MNPIVLRLLFLLMFGIHAALPVDAVAAENNATATARCGRLSQKDPALRALPEIPEYAWDEGLCVYTSLANGIAKLRGFPDDLKSIRDQIALLLKLRFEHKKDGTRPDGKPRHDVSCNVLCWIIDKKCKEHFKDLNAKVHSPKKWSALAMANRPDTAVILHYRVHKEKGQYIHHAVLLSETDPKLDEQKSAKIRVIDPAGKPGAATVTETGGSIIEIESSVQGGRTFQLKLDNRPGAHIELVKILTIGKR